MVFKTKILQLKKTKYVLLCAYWPLSAAMLLSEATNQEEDKLCFFLFNCDNYTLSICAQKLIKLCEIKILM